MISGFTTAAFTGQHSDGDDATQAGSVVSELKAKKLQLHSERKFEKEPCCRCEAAGSRHSEINPNCQFVSNNCWRADYLFMISKNKKTQWHCRKLPVLLSELRWINRHVKYLPSTRLSVRSLFDMMEDPLSSEANARLRWGSVGASWFSCNLYHYRLIPKRSSCDHHFRGLSGIVLWRVINPASSMLVDGTWTKLKNQKVDSKYIFLKYVFCHFGYHTDVCSSVYLSDNR